MTGAAPPIVLVVMGVSGSGKSTVGAELADRLGWDFAEGDDFHPPSNIAKMAAGQPLDDEDRWPWLNRISAWIHEHTAAHRPGVIACSALKQSYRDVLRGEHVAFVMLDAAVDEIVRRVATRPGHFMPVRLLGSQLSTLEPPVALERSIAVETSGSAADAAQEVITRLGLTPIPR